MFSLYLSYIKKLLGIGKKIILVVLVYFVIITLFSYFINKDKPKVTYDPVQKNREQIYKVINDPKLNGTKEGKTSIAIYKAIACGTIGEACTDNPADGNKNFKNSLFGFMSNLIVMPYANPPASGVYWAYSGLQNAGFVPKTYAAEGIGFGALRPFMNLWKVFRDISYMLLVLILVAIGFMIMFRAKINPQTVISVENALPKIVISLLLITFSFAIAGFLIDLMYVIIALSISVLSNNNTFYSAAQFQNEYLNADIGKLGGSFFVTKGPSTFGLTGLGFLMGIGNSMLNILGPPINAAVRAFGAIIAGLYGLRHNQDIFAAIYNALNDVSAAGFDLGWIPGALLWTGIGSIVVIISAGIGAFVLPQFIIAVLLLLTIILLLFRLLAVLFKAYLQILLLIIFAPLFLLFEAIPGKSALSYWLKSLIAELLTFPIIIILFLVGYILINMPSAPGTNVWAPPFLYGFDANAFSMLLGIGILFLIPDILKTVKELLGIKGLPIGIGPGTFFGGAVTPIGGGLGLLGQFGSLSLATRAIGEMKRGGIGALWGESSKKAAEEYGQAQKKPSGGTPPAPGG